MMKSTVKLFLFFLLVNEVAYAFPMGLLNISTHVFLVMLSLVVTFMFISISIGKELKELNQEAKQLTAIDREIKRLKKQLAN